MPVSHWLTDSDDCVRASAQAIIKSGLPHPNFATEDVPGAASGAPHRQMKTVDMWLGSTRFVVPASAAASNGMYPAKHPYHYQKLRGSLPQFYPPGPVGPEIDGMGSMVEVTFKCSMDEKYLASWGKTYQSKNEAIQRVQSEYDRRLRVLPDTKGEVVVSMRNDLGMTEVLLDRYTEANGQRAWEATYLPTGRDLAGLDGSVASIGCTTRHDPVERRYGLVGWRCGTSLRVTPQGGVLIEIYVSQLQHMPAVFEQVKQLLVNAKRAQ